MERGGSQGSLESLRELNRLRVVDALRSAGRLSRSEIARRTGLSRSTVSTLVADLVERGFIVERADDDDAAPPRAARRRCSASTAPPAPPSASTSTTTSVRVAVSDLSRTVLAEAVEPVDVDHDAGRSMDLAARLVEPGARPRPASTRRRVLGVGVAIAGPVDAEHGALHRSSILPGWDGVDLADELGARLGLPVHVDNDANLGALAEVTLGAGRNARHAAYLQISGGIGAGLIVDGRPFRGAFGAAGEMGHIVVDDNGAICRCGNRGCLETVASGPALIAPARREPRRRA